MIEITMTLGKQTKNKLVYEAKDSEVPAVYVEKTALPTSPQTIILTIKEKD